MEQIKSGASVLILHNNCCDSLNKLKTELDSKKVSTEIKPIGNIQELAKTSTFDVVIVHEANKFDNILNIFTILKPDGIFILNQITSEASNSELELKVNGFTNITSKQIGEYTEFVAVKPKYDVGSSAKLNLKKPAAVWKLDDDDAEETIDPDNLLDEDDLKKPAADSLRVCGTTGKRKACKDCSCGLAEELAGEVTDAKDTSNVKSSCGSCYLGDAFRCASCPYLGMPAFKPGEKIQLSANLLKDDI